MVIEKNLPWFFFQDHLFLKILNGLTYSLRCYKYNIVFVLKNAELRKNILSATTRSDIINLLGAIILIMRYKFTSWGDIWFLRSKWKYIDPSYMGNNGFKSPRFDNLWSCIQLSRQKNPIPKGMSIKEWEWQLVNDHIENFNNHRLKRLYPSYRLCVNESFSRWYVLGGDCINLGMKQYVQMACNPDTGWKK